MAQHVIGLDVGTWSIKTAVLESGLRRFSLDGFTEYVLPKDTAGLNCETLPESVKNSLADVGERSPVIITAVPGGRVMTREISLPFDDDKRVRSVLPFELDGQLPASVDDLVFDYVKLGEQDSGSSDLMVSAVAQHWLADFLSDLKQAGADPKSVGLATMAYTSLVPRLVEAGSLGVEEDLSDHDIAFIDLGHQSSSLCIVRNGKPVAIRTLGRGGLQVTQALAQSLGLEFSEAETVKHTGVRLDGHVPAGVTPEEHEHRVRVVGEALGPIVRDLRMTLHAHVSKTGRNISTAFVFGGTSRLPGLVAMLDQALGLSLKVPRVTRMAWSQLEQSDAVDRCSPLATALALRNVVDTQTSPQVDFRQDAFAFESDFKAFRDRAWWLAVVAMLFVGALFFRQFHARSVLLDQQDALVTELKSFSKASFGKELTSFDTVASKILSGAKNEAGIDDLFPKITAFRAFYLITQAQDATNAMSSEGLKAPEPDPKSSKNDAKEAGKEGEGSESQEDKEANDSRYRVEFKSVNVDFEKAVIRGEANDIVALAEFEGRLKKIPCFKEVDRTDAKESRDRERKTWKEFTVQIKLECELEQTSASGSKNSGQKTSGGK